jgi:hypothetical protein
VVLLRGFRSTVGTAGHEKRGPPERLPSSLDEFIGAIQEAFHGVSVEMFEIRNMISIFCIEYSYKSLQKTSLLVVGVALADLAMDRRKWLKKTHSSGRTSSASSLAGGIRLQSTSLGLQLRS